MQIKRTKGDKIFDVINVLFFAFLSFLFLAPVLHVLFSSISRPELVLKEEGLVLYPHGFSLTAYKMAFQNKSLPTGFLNSFIYSIGTCVLGLVLSLMGGYCCYKRTFGARKVLMKLLIFTMFFSGGMVPSYLLIHKLHLYDTMWAIILPSVLSVWNIIMIRTAFMELPAGLEESARIDGANDFVILFRIFAPLCKALLAVLALYYVVGMWNSWFSAMIYLQDRDKFPLQLILREILILNDSSSFLPTDLKTELYKPLVRYATIMISLVPIFCFYPFVQKYFEKGVMLGSMKG